MYQTSLPKTLPTMYDLPSENPKELGLPDEFHLLQPEFLRLNFRPPNYACEQIFTGSDLNLYYDPNHTQWYKRPDWFVSVNVSPLYKNGDLRLSYVIWQEGITPFIIVELLSPGTEKEDLGETLRDVKKPPTKWEVYEQILRIPYYAVFDRYKYEFRMFKLDGGRYMEIDLSSSDSRFWIPEIELGLGVWEGSYNNIQQPWLRWYDVSGNWVLTPTEQERRQKERLIEQLRNLGVEPDI